MADEPSKPGLQLSFGQLHLTATVALLASVAGGFYSAVSWIERVQNVTARNAELVGEAAKQIEAIRLMIAQQDEHFDKQDDTINQRIFELQQTLAKMQSNYHEVQTLQDRYDHAFATYQPQPKRRR
jgi:hypothetical protein